MAGQVAWYFVAGLVATYTFLRALLRLTQHEKEPQTLATLLPFVSPLLGLGTQKTKFFVKLRDAHGLPIYTLRMPGSRTYVITSLSLVPALQRQIRILSFHPIELRAAERVMGLTRTGCEILGANMNHDDSYLGSFVKALHPALSPGPGLDEINETSVQLLAASLGRRKTAAGVDMFQWIRHEMFMATTNAIYARASFQARESLIPDLMEYFQKAYHEHGSPLVKCRFAYNTRHGLGPEDMARTEIGQISATVTNTVLAAFWFIWHIFSDPAVLEDCRSEVERLVGRDEHTGIRTLDLSRIRTSCPVLLSTWHEMLRYRHIGIQARAVMEDHLFDGRYLLKKGATVMCVIPALHSDTSVWGPDAAEFNHRRFVREDGAGAKRANAFRGFGGGSTLCPGRHFATNEALSFAALLMTRFDVRPVAGVWKEPRVDMPLTVSLPLPIEPVEVKIVPKAEQEWKVLFSASAK
ncbi:uncharacterized protein THITE_35712 [Thermothielavioides terrestris NRRL 8126]|uniref:Cytochrome P450 n=1 Tax=Thermothielavioides terrestris (strain ATCC 38088 / NRRL 8126) TaxID=578455 RepID=G2QZN9_THETT|nr:uncharacterized protein THITE_35712 [Thermothielavioides terrestris NRRL 8126]AEO66368.1 hypothetical protein THITE_35712 [Thermothielavioides terrestris NRRL 8126]